CLACDPDGFPPANASGRGCQCSCRLAAAQKPLSVFGKVFTAGLEKRVISSDCALHSVGSPVSLTAAVLFKALQLEAAHAEAWLDANWLFSRCGGADCSGLRR